MKVFISADIEGTCGIADWSETDRATPRDYDIFRAQMTQEVKAACVGAISAGAGEIFIKDAHDSARNLDIAALPHEARVLRGWTGDPLCMMSGIDRGGFGAAFFTGYHAWASSGGNPLSHTMNTRLELVTINGVRASEFLINAYTAGYYGVPAPFLSGDRALCAFAEELIPGMVTVPVNEGIGGGVYSMHPELAVKAIREGAEEAVRRAADCQVPLPAYFQASVRFREHKTAWALHFYPGATLEDEKNVCFEHDDWYEMLRFFHFVLSD